MLRLEAMNFIDEQMRPRWPKPGWNPTPEQIADLVVWLSSPDITYEIARLAVREHAGSKEGGFGKPKIHHLRTALNNFRPKQETKTEQPDPTVFVMYEGGGRGTLLAGYHFPIIVRPGDNAMKAAERMRSAHEERVGGEWKVYSDATYPQMNGMRHEFYAKRTEQTGGE